MKKILFVLIAGIVSANMMAQKSVETVTNEKIKYTVTKNDPDQYNRTRLTLDPINVDLYMGTSLSFAAKLETQISKFVPQVSYSRAYFEANVDKGPATRSTYELGTKLIISERNVDKQDVHVTLHSSTTTEGNYRVTHEKYINVPATIKRISSFYFGYFHWTTPMVITNGQSSNDGANGINSYYHYAKADGSLNVPIHDWAGYSGTDVQPFGIKDSPSIMERLSGIKVGYNLRTIENLFVNVDNWGERKVRKINDFSFNLLYAFDIQMDHFTDNAGVEWQYEATTKKLTRHLGWNLEYAKQFRVVGWHWGIGYNPAQKVEHGGVKSIMDNGFNMGVGFSFSLSVHKGFLIKQPEPAK